MELLLALFFSSTVYLAKEKYCQTDTAIVETIGVCDALGQCRVKLSNGKTRVVDKPLEGDTVTTTSCGNK